MSLGLRLSLLPLLIAGCAAQRLEVPDSDWETVPAPTRAAVDRQIAAELAAAQAELTAATAGLAELRRSLPSSVTASPAPAAPIAAPPAAPTPPTPPTPPPAAAAAGDEWATAMRDHEHARVDARARVDAAKLAWQRADLSWRELRLGAANEALAMIDYKRELVRAQAIDHNLPGTDTYNVAPLRGQFSQAQQRWYAIESKARQARTAFEHLSATLASAKEAYAQLMRGIPLQASVVATDDRPPSLTLTGWAVTRADIRRRRGLRHFLDDAANAPAQLHKVALRLTVRAVPAAPMPTTVSTSRAPAAEVHGNAPVPATTAAMHPADAAAAGLSTGTSSPEATGKPAGRPLAPVPAGSPSIPAGGISTSKPTPAAQANPPAAAANGKPAPGAPPASPPTATASAVARPGSPTSPAATVPASSKPAPAAVQASPPVAAGTAVAKPPSPTPPAPASGKPSTATATQTPAAKPVD